MDNPEDGMPQSPKIAASNSATGHSGSSAKKQQPNRQPDQQPDKPQQPERLGQPEMVGMPAGRLAFPV